MRHIHSRRGASHEPLPCSGALLLPLVLLSGACLTPVEKLPPGPFRYDDVEVTGATYTGSANAVVASYRALERTLVDDLEPGVVKLSDLSPALEPYEGGKLDVLSATGEPDVPDRFHYARTGLPNYDDFFRACAEYNALVSQASYSVRKTVAICEKLIGEERDPHTTFGVLLREAMDVEPPEGDGPVATLAREVHQMRELIRILDQLCDAAGDKAKQLKESGENLAENADELKDTPELVLAPDLVPRVIAENLRMIGYSGVEIAAVASDLASVED